MSKRDLSTAQSAAHYTRGWETIGHGLSMFAASVRIHVALSAFAGIGLGVVWFLDGLGPLRDQLLPYLKSTLREDSTAAFFASFSGRTVPFLLHQLMLCCLVGFGLVFAFGFAISIVRGRSLNRDSHERGARLIDVPMEQRRARIAHVLGVGSAANACAITLRLLFMDGVRRSLVATYFWTYLATRFELVRWLASGDSSLPVVWLDTARFPSGFYRAETVFEQLRGRVFGGATPLMLAVEVLPLAAGLVLLYWLGQRIWRRRSDAEKPEFKVAGVPLPAGKETYHLLFCGSPGSGKSTAIKDLLDQVREQGRRAIVYDLSGEYLELYYRPGIDKILNPLDERSEVWTPWADAHSYADYVALSKSLFPPEGNDPFWAQAGAELFRSCLLVLGRASNHPRQVFRGKKDKDFRLNAELYGMLNERPLAALHDALADTPAARLLDPKAGSMPQNLLATVTSRLGPWSQLPDPLVGQAPFSIRDFLATDNGTDGWLFLTASEDQAAFLKPLISLWTDLCATTLLTLPPAQHSRWWFILDEVASLQNLPALPGLLSRGRKHGVAVVLGLQALPQLRAAYGRDGAAALCAQPQTWLVLRQVEPETADWLRSALGQVEIETPETTVSMGAHAQRDGFALQRRRAVVSLALASEIMTLPDLTGFLRLPGSEDIFRVGYKTKKRPERKIPAFVPRPIRQPNRAAQRRKHESRSH